MSNPYAPTSEDLSLHVEYERIGGQQEADIAKLKAAARVFRSVVAGLTLPLGMPGPYDRDEVLETLDGILSAPDRANDEAAWVAAAQARQDYHDAVADARRDMREGV
ncbi:MAG: hypothetical protein KGL39_52295 [Patescibacteria group bacterium]|nr:hypothetical protein [Patescibacteria group bacterium]